VGIGLAVAEVFIAGSDDG